MPEHGLVCSGRWPAERKGHVWKQDVFQVEEELRGNTGDLPAQCVVTFPLAHPQRFSWGDYGREKVTFKCHCACLSLAGDLSVNRESPGAWTLSGSSWDGDMCSTLVPMYLVLAFAVSAFKHKKTVLPF